MRIDDLIQPDESREELRVLADRCFQFITEAQNRPLLKNLPKEYGDFHKVKVRKRKSDAPKLFSTMFNESFEDEVKDLRERAIFANGEVSFRPSDELNIEPFYIFPIDGYDFMYSHEVENSNHDYKQVFDSILEQFGPTGNTVITDLLKFTYTSDNLLEGIESGAEIIFYNIPCFYALRAATVDNYPNLIKEIQEIQNAFSV